MKVEAAVALYVPGAQAGHDVVSGLPWPVALLYRPAEHWLHAELPGVSIYLPIAQAVHWELAVAAEKVPAVHWAQAVPAAPA